MLGDCCLGSGGNDGWQGLFPAEVVPAKPSLRTMRLVIEHCWLWECQVQAAQCAPSRAQR
jgi:hypothetical protein